MMLAFTRRRMCARTSIGPPRIEKRIKSTVVLIKRRWENTSRYEYIYGSVLQMIFYSYRLFLVLKVQPNSSHLEPSRTNRPLITSHINNFHLLFFFQCLLLFIKVFVLSAFTLILVDSSVRKKAPLEPFCMQFGAKVLI